jgi:hypothetical protein
VKIPAQIKASRKAIASIQLSHTMPPSIKPPAEL